VFDEKTDIEIGAKAISTAVPAIAGGLIQFLLEKVTHRNEVYICLLKVYIEIPMLS
jgi:hypothetical protein